MTTAMAEPAGDETHGAQEGPFPFVVLYDGICGLCNRTVQFLLKRDRRGRFRYAALQNAFARGLLARHGVDAADLNTVYLVLDAAGPNERLLPKARAVLRMLRELGGFWRVVSWLGVLPSGLLNGGYDFIARRRYRWWGKYESCPLPSKAQRERFLD